MRLSFTVPGPIMGKQRAGRRVLAGGRVRSFNPPKSAKNEHLIRQYAALRMRGRQLITGAVGMTIRVYKVPPKSWSQKRRSAAKHVTGKPDLDNIVKLVLDACQTCVFRNDTQIAHLVASRCYDTTERTEIEIVDLEAV